MVIKSAQNMFQFISLNQKNLPKKQKHTIPKAMGPHLWPVKTKLAIEEEGSMMLSTGKVLIFKDWVWGTLENPKSEPDFYHSKGENKCQENHGLCGPSIRRYLKGPQLSTKDEYIYIYNISAWWF